MSIQSRLYRGLPLATRLEHTRRALMTLPRLDQPRVLDIGCGTGVPTLELARRCRGLTVGLDTDFDSLEALGASARVPDNAAPVQVVQASMLRMPFPDESFDIVWSEGSAHFVGVENALRDWRRLIRPGGFMALHEIVWLRPNPPPETTNYWAGRFPSFTTAAEYAAMIPGLGYDLLDYFCLPESAWWDECYAPLARRIDEWRERHAGDAAVLRELEAAERDVDFFRDHSDWCGSAFFVMQRRD
jgi:SAM-dependent methyltransferase